MSNNSALGRENIDETMSLIKKLAEERKINDVVIASTTGFTAEKAIEKLNDTSLKLTFVGTSRDKFPSELIAELQKKGYNVCFSDETKYDEPEKMDNKQLSSGVQMSIKIALIAAQEGYVSTAKDIISMGKWDTALVIKHVSNPLQKKITAFIRTFYKAATIYPTSNLVRAQILFFYLHKKELEASIDAYYLTGLLNSIFQTRNVKGDVLELGTYKGGSTILSARLLKKISSNKQIFACDTFSGHPYDDRYSTWLKRKGQFSDTSEEYVNSKFKKFDVANKIFTIKGLFEETLLKNFEDKLFSHCFLDCDLYDSTKYALNFLKSRINVGGQIVFHEYLDSQWGTTKAIDEWCNQNNFYIDLKPVPHVSF